MGFPSFCFVFRSISIMADFHQFPSILKAFLHFKELAHFRKLISGYFNRNIFEFIAPLPCILPFLSIQKAPLSFAFSNVACAASLFYVFCVCAHIVLNFLALVHGYVLYCILLIVWCFCAFSDCSCIYVSVFFLFFFIVKFTSQYC